MIEGVRGQAGCFDNEFSIESLAPAKLRAGPFSNPLVSLCHPRGGD